MTFINTMQQSTDRCRLKSKKYEKEKNIMKKSIKVLVLVFIIIVISTLPVLAEKSLIQVFIRGKSLNLTPIVEGNPLDFTTILENNRTLIPIKLISGELGLDVEYLEVKKIVKIKKEDLTIELEIGSVDAKVNGKQVELDIKPLIKDNNIFVPLRFIAETLGEKVIWDGEAKIVLVGKFTDEAIIEDTFLYFNKEYNYTMRFPNSWKEEAIIKTEEGTLYVYDKKSAERFIEDGYENFGPVFEIRCSEDYPLSLIYEGDYVLNYNDGKYLEVLFCRDFQFYPETIDSYKKIASEAKEILGSFRIIDETEIDKFWDTLISVPDNYTGLDIYWRHIDTDIMEKVDDIIEKYGVGVLLKGLESNNVYSQYYCINRLVEYYNYDHIRTHAIAKITPFLSNSNNKLKHGAEFAINVLGKKFDSPYILSGNNGIKIFALFNDYSDYGSYNELWIIKDDKLSKLYSFTDPQTYIDTTETIKFSPDNNKIAVQTSSRKSNSLNIIDLNNKNASPEIMKLVIEKVAKDNKDYNNTYPDGAYNFCGNLKWIDNNIVEFETNLAYDYMEIMEQVIVKYNVLDNSLEYVKVENESKN